jgi:methyl-accepting chemotaxis protein
MTDLFLGLIALGVIVMAAIQVGAIVMAIRAARRVEGAIGELQQDIKPIVASLQTMSADAARTTAKVATQVDRLEKTLNDVSARINQTASAVQDVVVAPIREAMAIVQGLKAAFGALTALSGQRPARRAATPEEDDPPFVG